MSDTSQFRQTTRKQTTSDLEFLMREHYELQRLKHAPYMGIVSASFWAPPALYNRLMGFAKASGQPRNSYLLQRIMQGLITYDVANPHPTTVSSVSSSSTRQYVVRLPEPALAHARWLAETLGITLGQVLVNCLTATTAGAQAAS